jgi:hypothetical protein
MIEGKEVSSVIGEYTADPDNPLSRKEVPVLTLEGFDFDKDLDKGSKNYEVEDLQVEPPEYNKVFISVKTTGTMKFSEGMCYELLDRGGYRFLGGASIVKKNFLLLSFYNFESLPKGRNVAYELKIPQLETDKEGVKKIGEVPMVNELRRAELSNRNDLEPGDLIPERGLYSSIEFGLGSFSFDTSLIEEGMLRLVIDVSKGVSVQRGKRLSKAKRSIAMQNFYKNIDLKLGLVDVDVEKQLLDRLNKIEQEEDTDADKPEEETEEKAKPETE